MSLGKWGLARQRSSWRRPCTSIGLRRCAMLQRGKPSSLGARTSPGVGRRPCRLNVQRGARIRFFPSPYETPKVMQDPIQTHDAFLV